MARWPRSATRVTSETADASARRGSANDWERPRAVLEVRRDLLEHESRREPQRTTLEAVEERADSDVCDGPRQCRTGAHVDAIAKRQVLLRVVAFETKRVGVHEHVAVPIRRRRADDDASTGLHRTATDLGLAHARAR